jgi:hypothetical protein
VQKDEGSQILAGDFVGRGKSNFDGFAQNLNEDAIIL